MYAQIPVNTISDIFSAEDDAPTTVGGGWGGEPVILNAFHGQTDPLAGKPMYEYTEEPIRSLAESGEALPFTAPAEQPVVPTVPAPAAPEQYSQSYFDAIKPTGGLVGVWNTVRNQVQYGIPGLFTSAKNRVLGLFGGSASAAGSASATGARSASTTDSSSWMLWVLLAGAAAAVYFGTRKGGFLKKLGKSSVKL